MVHYVLLKFKAGTDVDAIELNMRETYRQLEQELLDGREAEVLLVLHLFKVV